MFRSEIGSTLEPRSIPGGSRIPKPGSQSRVEKGHHEGQYGRSVVAHVWTRCSTGYRHGCSNRDTRPTVEIPAVLMRAIGAVPVSQRVAVGAVSLVIAG